MQNVYSWVTSEVLEGWNTGVAIKCEKEDIEEWQESTFIVNNVETK